MRMIAIGLGALLVSGCSAYHTNTGPKVLLTGMVIYSAIEYSRNPTPFPSFSSFYEFNSPLPPAPLAPERKVVEQDCSKPLEDPTANLKCR